MADVARPVLSTRVSHRQSNSQEDFNRRLKHLQRSDPVDPQELTRRLNAAIIEARYYGHRDGGRRRLANARGSDGGQSQSRSPSEASTPRQDVRQSTLNPFNVARSTLILDGPRDDDPMSRVANALKACYEADPQRPPSVTAERKEIEQRRRAQSRTSVRTTSPETTRGSPRKLAAISASKIVEVEKPMDFTPRPHSSAPATNIAEAFKSRGARKGPAPLILTVMPKAVKPNMVDVSSPITTKPPSALLDLEPLSPFGATFSENGGSFLVYQPKEVQLTDSPDMLSPEKETPYTPTKGLSPMEGTKRRSSSPSAVHSSDYFTQRQPETQPRESQGKRQTRQYNQTSSSEDEEKVPSVAGIGIGRRRRSIKNFRLSQNSETDGTDGQSDVGMSPVFETSAAQSSRTSLGQSTVPSHAGHKRMPSKRVGYTPEEFVELGYPGGPSETVQTETLHEQRTSAPVSPLQVATDEFPSPDDVRNISPVNAPWPVNMPKRQSSLPPEQEQPPTNKRHSIPRKPVGSGIYEGSFQNGTIRPVFTQKPARHDSTGFTVAREFLRDSIDSEHVRHVHTAALHGTNEPSYTFQSMAGAQQDLPKLTTALPRPGKMEEIADGIVLINSDSPIVGKQIRMPQIPAPGHPQFREPSYIKELQISPDGSRKNSAAATSPTSNHLSPTFDSSAQRFSTTSEVGENSRSTLNRVPSRERRATDATITAFSSRPDYRARPLIQDAPVIPLSPMHLDRPKTAGARSSSPLPSPVPPMPTKLPTKIKFPPRANVTELGVMSAESLKLLHEQEALLRKRYDAVLNPIDDALLKKPQAAVEIGPNGMPVESPKKHKHARSKSSEIGTSLRQASVSTTDLDLIRHQENIAREQAAIRMQRRNLGAAARRPSAPGEYYYNQQSPVVLEVHQPYSRQAGGDPVGLPQSFSHAQAGNTKSAFTFDDDTQARKRKPTWKFWKKK